MVETRITVGQHGVQGVVHAGETDIDIGEDLRKRHIHDVAIRSSDDVTI